MSGEHSEVYTFGSPIDFVPYRVISLVPSLTESLFDLGLGDRIIAVSDYALHPAEGIADLPRVGGPKSPDLDAIIRMRPDLVLMDEDDNRREDAEALESAGVPVWSTCPRTVQDALNLLYNIMYTFEEASMRPRIRAIEYAYDWVSGMTRDRPGVPVFAPIWRDPWMTFNCETFCHDLLRVCGGANIFADAESRYPEIALDDVIAAAPEVILLPSEPFEFTQADADELAALDTPAAQNGRIHLIDGTLLTWPGTRLAKALAELPALFEWEGESGA
jgi:ABC-type Fe3+-hydroxamate transport system substrate-binding protein